MKKGAASRSIGRKGLLIGAACLCLAAVLVLLWRWGSGGTAGETGGDTMPGELYPTLWRQGRAFTWADVAHEPDLEEGWAALGPLEGPTTDEAAREDLWLYADFPATGTVYINERYPDALYVRMTTDWFADRWVRFTIPELRKPILCWEGRLYCAADHSYPDVKAPRELPEGCVEVGRVEKISEDKVPDETGEITKWYQGSLVWMDPENPEVIYLQATRTWREGSYPIYAPAHVMRLEQAGGLTIPPGIALEP